MNEDPTMRLPALLLSAALLGVSSLCAAPDGDRLVIDLPAVLQLAGARSLDVQIAREKLAEAKAVHESTVWQFFPAIVPGVGYRRHDGLVQDVAGKIVDVHKDSYTLGPTIAAQLDLGDAVYKNLAARQLVVAARSAVESQRQDSALAAVRGYFDLAKAQAAVTVVAESVRIAEDLAAQVKQAVGAGIAFQGDALRADVQAERNRLASRQAQERAAVCAARLVQVLHLDAKVSLATRTEDLVPLTLVAPDSALDVLVARALADRPERARSRAQVSAARKMKDGAKHGPLVPSLGAQVFAGGLGGGTDGSPGRFGRSEDHQFTLGWRIGPGGLFDKGRIHAEQARLHVAQLTDGKLVDEITREVVESRARLLSLSDQIATAGRAVRAAEEGLRLTAQRKEFAVGIVLEHVQAEQDLTRARLDRLEIVAELDKAQFEAMHAVGATVAAPR